MTDFPEARFRDLVSLYMDGSLSMAEEGELLGLLEDPDRRVSFLELCRVNRELEGLTTAITPESVMVARVMTTLAALPSPGTEPRTPAPRHRSWLRLGIGGALAACLVLGTSLYFALPPSNPSVPNVAVSPDEPAIAVVREVRGRAFVRVPGGWVPASPGLGIAAQRGVGTGGGDSRLVLEFPDGTRVELGPDTMIESLSDANATDTQPRITVAEGALTARRTPGSSSHAVTVVTPHGEASVHKDGGAFTLEASEGWTEVRVSDGQIHFKRRNDPESVDVSSGGSVVAAEGQLVAKPAEGHLPSSAGKAISVDSGKRLENVGGIAGVCFTPDGKGLTVVERQAGQVVQWDLTIPNPVPFTILSSGQPMMGSRTSGTILSAAISNAADYLATVGMDRGVTLVHATRDSVSTFPQIGQGRCLSFSSDSKWLATGGEDGVLRLYQTATADEVVAYQETEGRPISPRGEKDLSASRSSTLTSAKSVWLTPLWGVSSVAISPASRWVAVGLANRRVRVRALDTGIEVPMDATLHHTDIVRDVAFTPDNATLVSASHKEVVLWDMSKGQPSRVLKLGGPIAISADGRWLATGWFTPTIIDLRTGQPLATITGHRGPVTALAFDPSSSRLALGGGRSLVIIDVPAQP